jgi:hypothetical protein
MNPAALEIGTEPDLCDSKQASPQGKHEKHVGHIICNLALFSGMVNAQDNIEKKKIEFQISSVENL